MRVVIASLLAIGLSTGGCDRQSPANGQGEAAANEAAPPSPETAPQAEPAGKIDRSHKGEAAPDFAFKAPGGESITLASFKGKPMLVNLWATWCAPCVAEMPTLDALAARDSATLQVVTISQDLDGAAKVDPYFDKAGFKALKRYLDPDLRFSVGMNASLPTTILYDAQGKEVWRIAGRRDWTSPETRALLAEASS